MTSILVIDCAETPLMFYQRFRLLARTTGAALLNNQQPSTRYIWQISLSMAIGLAGLLSPTYLLAEIADEKTPSDYQMSDRAQTDVTDAAPSVQAGPGGKMTLGSKQRTKLESLFEWHTHFLWESRYVSEGRDNLSGDSIASLSSEFVIGEINFIPWYAYSPDTDYRELNLNFLYGVRPVEDLAIYIGYNHLRAHYLGEHAYDNEVRIDLAYKLLDKLGIAAVVYHSFKANGSFTEVTAKYFDNIDKGINYSVQGGVGINTGHVPDGHKGLNHFELRANASYLPFIQAELYAYTAYNIAIDRDPEKYAGDVLLGDFLWAGIGFIYLF